MQVLISAAVLALAGFLLVMFRRARAKNAKPTMPDPAERRELIEPVEPPAHVRKALHDAEMLGQAIWRFDTAAARASDALTECFPDKRLPDPQMFGWVVTDDGADSGALHVHFLGAAGADLEVLYRVRIGGGGMPPVVEVMDPPIALAPHVRGPATALRRARKAPVPRVNAPYNEVVLPAELVGQAGWLVYALAATTNPEEMLVGGHTRIKVSADGTTVEEIFPFTRTDLRVPAGKEVAMTTLTHIVSATPLEHHVFLGLLHKQYLRVLTELGAWDVEHGRIVYCGPFPT
ncbi:MAG TPA: hypothetical protein VHW23_05210 [Kofleriaceae bacterium]|jgi:hypothetical protein|nr:hypothetical protein [Kofleriaceae bacterium]